MKKMKKSQEEEKPKSPSLLEKAEELCEVKSLLYF
jgi:hypothetical protein